MAELGVGALPFMRAKLSSALGNTHTHTHEFQTTSI